MDSSLSGAKRRCGHAFWVRIAILSFSWTLLRCDMRAGCLRGVPVARWLPRLFLQVRTHAHVGKLRFRSRPGLHGFRDYHCPLLRLSCRSQSNSKRYHRRPSELGTWNTADGGLPTTIKKTPSGTRTLSRKLVRCRALTPCPGLRHHRSDFKILLYVMGWCYGATELLRRMSSCSTARPR